VDRGGARIVSVLATRFGLDFDSSSARASASEAAIISPSHQPALRVPSVPARRNAPRRAVMLVSLRRTLCVVLFSSVFGLGCSEAKPAPPTPAASAPKTATDGVAAADKAPTGATSMTNAPKPMDAAKPTLRFTGIPNQNTTDLNAKYEPLAKYLTAKLGIDVVYVPSVDYNASVEAFKSGDVQLAWFGGYTGVQARAAVPGARAIACGPRDLKFKSYFIANKSLGLKQGPDFPMAFEGKKFTFGSNSSTSGRLMPEYFIRKFTKKSPKEFFGAEPNYSGGHDKTAALVEAGTFETGAIDYTVYDKLVKEKKVDPEIVQIIWVTPEYADYNFTVHPTIDTTLGAGFTDKLQKVLTSIQGDDLKVLSAMDRQEGGLIACTNETFEDLRKLAVEIGLLR
jgi:phosphonate transport system substrate-binding protein